jgi:uncharacterized phage-associated protein
MPTALDVARFFVQLAPSPKFEEEADPICNLRLQKLLYYAQSWHLAAFGAPLFAERIEAWKLGPVVRDVYPVFKGKFVILPEDAGEPVSLADHNKQFIKWVWERYKRFSATALRDMTHREAPWVQARGGLSAEARSDAEITLESMRAYFLPRYVEYLKRRDPRIDTAVWLASADDFVEGRARPAKDILREIRGRRTGQHPTANQ